MDKSIVSREQQKEYKSHILQGFKSVINFYRMEHSEDVIELFHTFGYMLVCGLFGEGDIRARQRMEHMAANDWEKIQSRIREEETQRWSEMLDGSRELAETVREVKQYEIPNLTVSVWNNLTDVLQNLLEYYQEIPEPEFLYDVVRGVLDLCVNTKTDLNRYVLPDRIVYQIAKLMQSEQMEQAEGRRVRLLDSQYGSGNMLLAAGKCMEHAQLCGYEQDGRLRMSAKILSILAGRAIWTLTGEFLEDREAGQFDFVLTNPPFGNETVPEYVRDWFLPGALGRVRGKHNLFVVRSLQMLGENGRAAIVVPDSFLFSSKTETVAVRRWLLESYCAEGIISLPQKTFYPSTMTNASILIVSNPFMQMGWMNGKTPYLFFYQWSEDADKEQAGQELKEIWNQRDYYFEKWSRQAGGSHLGAVQTPEYWEHPNFWFAGMETVEQEKWNLLPGHYQPVEREELRFEDPQILLEELIREQEGLLEQMRRLAGEVDGL